VIDHITLIVSDYEKSKRFYLAALEPLGYELVMELTREQLPDLPVAATVGLGVGGKPDLWIREGDGELAPTHIAFAAETHAVVDAFHQAALAAGAKDHGRPGPRPHYHPGYYGAFVLDPDGYNIEAVCHRKA
jgi:catechol 2,3-dioxygenase-like lactoylglutathione lyase family enzyme